MRFRERKNQQQSCGSIFTIRFAEEASCFVRFTLQKASHSSFFAAGQQSVWESSVVCEGSPKIAFLAVVALPMQIFIGMASDSIVTILPPHTMAFCAPMLWGNGPKIIFSPCLARLQLRNKLLMEAKGRLLIAGSSHPVDLFPALFSPLTLCYNCCIAKTGVKRKQSNFTEDTYTQTHKHSYAINLSCTIYAKALAANCTILAFLQPIHGFWQRRSRIVLTTHF